MATSLQRRCLNSYISAQNQVCRIIGIEAQSLAVTSQSLVRLPQIHEGAAQIAVRVHEVRI